MTDIDSSVADIGHRAISYWEIDGLSTLLQSTVLLLFGFSYIWKPANRPTDLFLTGLLVIVAYLFLSRKSPVMRWLKARITYPRTGYVALSKNQAVAAQKEELKRHPEWWLFPAMGLFPALQEDPWIAAVAITILLGVFLGVTRGRFEFSWLVIPGVWLSWVILAFFPVSCECPASASGRALGSLLIAYAIVYFIKGTIQLVRYIYQHPKALA